MDKVINTVKDLSSVILRHIAVNNYAVFMNIKLS